MLPEQNHTSYIKFCMIRPAFLNLPADVLPTNILFHSANFFLLNPTVFVLFVFFTPEFHLALLPHQENFNA